MTKTYFEGCSENKPDDFDSTKLDDFLTLDNELTKAKLIKFIEIRLANHAAEKEKEIAELNARVAELLEALEKIEECGYLRGGDTYMIEITSKALGKAKQVKE
ncbi:MAG TPA: hypothetical protein VGD04_10310 [Methylophilus sp.]